MKNFTLFSVFFVVVFLSVVTMAQTNFWERINSPDIGAIAINASGTIFAATNGGISHSTDNGATWIKSDSVLDLFVWHFAFKSSTIFAAGFGLFRSTDDGLNWTKISDAAKIGGIAVNDSGHIFIVWGNETGSGFERSTDNGETWINIAPESYSGAIAINAAGTIFSGGISGVFRSTDNGTSWAYTEISPGSSYSVNLLAISSSGYIFAGTYSRGVYHSTDNGEHWIPSNAIISIHLSYFSINTIGHIFAGTYDKGVYRSTDDGANWTTVNTGLTNDTVSSLAINPSGTIFASTQNGLFRSVQSTTSVRELSTDAPLSFSLNQNYPNPFNPSTTIRFQVPISSFVNLKVYDVLGNEVATLVNEEKATGNYEVSFDAKGLSSGIYFYKLNVGSFVETKKMILMK